MCRYCCIATSVFLFMLITQLFRRIKCNLQTFKILFCALFRCRSRVLSWWMLQVPWKRVCILDFLSLSLYLSSAVLPLVQERRVLAGSLETYSSAQFLILHRRHPPQLKKLLEHGLLDFKKNNGNSPSPCYKKGMRSVEFLSFSPSF